MFWRANDRLKRRARHRFIWLALLLLIFSQLNMEPTIAKQQDQSFNRDQLITLLADLKDYPVVSETNPRINSKAYLLLDLTSGEVLTEKNGFLQLPVASTTKMITALVALEKLKLDDVATVSPTVSTVIGSKLNIRPGERIVVKDLIKALLLISANDAAVVLAEKYSQEEGKIDSFVDQMNQFTDRHNLNNSFYGDPAGLNDEEGFSTAFELAQTARLLLNQPVLREIVATPETTITSANGASVFNLKNTNRLLQPESSHYYPGAIGVKTGFTLEAGHCLVAAATINGRTMIGVVLNSNVFTVAAAAEEMVRLFNWAKRNVTFESY